MCGIAGIAIVPGHKIDPRALAYFAASLAHRGPDGAGHFMTDNAALVHTRLSIIDLATGGQPLFAGQAALIGNGEIYNDLELRADMPEINFASHSDCEPPLYLYLENQTAFTHRLRGMYALAIHDRTTGNVTLSRDPFGIKPLYYAVNETNIAFASEPAALLAAGFATRSIDRGKLDELLALQFTTGAQTIFPGIKRVLPGQTITIRQGRIAEIAHEAAIEAGPSPRDATEAIAQFDKIMTRSVDLHQRSDVPYGMFLSGGIDSAVILALMARLNDKPVLAFTAGFDVAAIADERDAAATTARAVGAHHERVTITEKMVWEHLPQIVGCMDDPAADYAIIPSWFLAQRARQDVKVVLSGEGGDELFCGYGRYRRAARPRLLGGRKMRARSIFDGLDILRNPSPHWRAGIQAAEAAATALDRSPLGRAQRTDMTDWLPHDLLLKLDRCLMAHAIEGRTPFVDREVARLAFALPDEWRTRKRLGKILPRLWLAENLPAARPFAPKQGFDVPIAAWIAGQGKQLGQLVSHSPLIAQIAKPDRVRSLFTNAANPKQGFAAWTLLFTALWYRHHILDLPSQGNVFDTLSAT